MFVVTWAFFGALSALLAFGMWRRSRLAWVIAVLIGIWGLFGGLLVFPALASGSEEIEWFAWALAFSLGTLCALFSPRMRSWIGWPAYQPKEKGM